MHIKDISDEPELRSILKDINADIKQDYSSKHFDDHMEQLLSIVETLITRKGVFHIAIHFSSSQLVCWTFDNPYSYQIYHADEIFSDHFMRLFAPLDAHLHTCIEHEQLVPILNTLKSLRNKPDGSELRNASIHMLNGYIALSFACDDTRYINFKNFISMNHLKAAS